MKLFYLSFIILALFSSFILSNSITNNSNSVLATNANLRSQSSSPLEANFDKVDNENNENDENDDNKRNENKISKRDKNFKDKNINIDNLPVKMEIVNHTSQSLSDLNQRIPSCSIFYVYMEGCSYAYRLFSDGYISNTWIGSYWGIGSSSYPIYVSDMSYYNGLYWNYGSYSYYLNYYDYYRASSSIYYYSPYNLNVGYQIQISQLYGGYRYFYNLYSNTDYCTDSFRVMHGYYGKRVYVNSCY